MTANISELIEQIRAWEAADKAYWEARKTLTNGALASKATGEAVARLDLHASAVTGRMHNDETLAAFTALADHAQALQARIDDMEATEKNRAKWCEACHGYGYDVFDINLNSCVVCGGEGIVWGETK